MSKQFVLCHKLAESYISLNLSAQPNERLLTTNNMFNASVFSQRDVDLILACSRDIRDNYDVCTYEDYLKVVEGMIEQKQVELNALKECYKELTIKF